MFSKKNWEGLKVTATKKKKNSKTKSVMISNLKSNIKIRYWL